MPSAGASGDLPLLSVDKASSNIGGTDAEVYTSTQSNGLSPLFGTFDLSLSKAQGAAAESPITIAHDASSSAVRDAVLALPSLRDAGVSLDVTRDGPGAGGAYAWTLTFAAAAQTSGAGPGSSRGPLGAGAGGGAELPLVSLAGSKLGGTGAGVSLKNRVVSGLAGNHTQAIVSAAPYPEVITEVQHFSCAARPTGYGANGADLSALNAETFTISFRGQTTGPISIYAAPTPEDLPACLPAGGPKPCAGDGSSLKEKLEALPAIGATTVTNVHPLADDGTTTTGTGTAIGTGTGLTAICSSPVRVRYFVNHTCDSDPDDSTTGDANVNCTRYVRENERNDTNAIGASMPEWTETMERWEAATPNVLAIEFGDAAVALGNLPLLKPNRQSLNTTAGTAIELTEAVRGAAPYVPEVQSVTTVSNASNATTLDVDGSDPLNSAGFFTLKLGDDGRATSPIPANAEPAVVKAALEAAIGSEVEVTRSDVSWGNGKAKSTMDGTDGASAYVWSITFHGQARPLGDLPLLQSGNGTCGASGGSECWLTTESGEDVGLSIKQVVPGVAPLSGTFRLQIIDDSTDIDASTDLGQLATSPVLSIDASAAEVEAVLRTLPLGGVASVSKLSEGNPAAGAGEVWLVTGLKATARIATVRADLSGAVDWCDECASGALGATWAGCSLCIDHETGAMSASAAQAMPTVRATPIRTSFTATGLGADLRSALRGLVYCPALNFNAEQGGLATISIRAADGDGVVSTDLTVAMRIDALNDAPTIVAPTLVLGKEDTEVAVEGVVVLDPDLDDGWAGVVEMSLDATHGNLSLATAPGLTFTEGAHCVLNRRTTAGATSCQRLSFRGGLDRANRALSSLSFTPTAHWNSMAVAEGEVAEDVQVVTLSADAVAEVQDITMAPASGKISGGDFTLELDCGLFFNGPKGIMDPNFNETRDSEAKALTLNLTGADKTAVSKPLTHLAPASGNETVTWNGDTTVSVETAVNGMIAECRASAEAAVVAALGKTAGAFSNSSKRDAYYLPYTNAHATVVKSTRGYGAEDSYKPSFVQWEVTFLNVPEGFPKMIIHTSSVAASDRADWDTSTPLLQTEATAGTELVVARSSMGRHTALTGTFTIGFDGETTKPLPSDASATDVKAALEALATVGDLAVSRMTANAHHAHIARHHATAEHSDGYAWWVTFLPSGTPAHVGPMATLVVDGAALGVSQATALEGARKACVQGMGDEAGGRVFDHAVSVVRASRDDTLPHLTSSLEDIVNPLHAYACAVAIKEVVSHAHDDFQLDVTQLNTGMTNDATITMSASDMGNYGGDGKALVATSTVRLRVEPVNDPPTLSLTNGLTFLDTDEDVVLPLDGLVAVGDADGVDGMMTVTIEVVRASVTIPRETVGWSNAALLTGTGTLDSSMSFTAPVAVCQALVNAALVVPATDFSGLAEIIITATDNEGAQALITVPIRVSE